MPDIRSTAALAALLLLASCGGAGPQPAIAVEDAWARATAPGRTSSAAYFTITNRGGRDRLLSVSSPAGAVSLHSASTDGGVMRMRPLETLEIPADSTVELAPGGAHVMITGLSGPLAPGSAVPIDLAFERSGERRVNAELRGAMH